MGDRVEGDKNVNTSESGQRSISIGGSAQGAIIITGDGNVIGDVSPHTSDRQTRSPVPTNKTLRQLVEDVLSDDELSDLCQDKFPKVYNQFTTGQTKPQRIRFLVEYVERQRENSKLLSAIEQINQAAYAEFIDNLDQD
jgi:hypothetical protein